MNIAELFVRLRADNSDLDRKLLASERQMARLHGSTQRLETGFKSTQLQTGRLGNQFASLAGQIAGVHPIVGNLAQVMGNFAIGGLVTVGVLGGVAAIALAYDALTGSARKAKKETDEFIKSLVDQARASYNASIAGRELALMRAEFELQDAQKGAGKLGLMGRVVGSMLGAPTGLDLFGDTTAQGKRVADAITAVEQAQKNLAKTWEDSQPPVKNAAAAVDGLKFSYNQLRDAIARTRAEAERSGEEFWRNLASSMFDSEELTKSLMPTTGVGPVDISDSVKLIREEIATREAGNRNAKNVQDAIWGAAQQSAGYIVSALNIGGGGRGSGIGGALGSVLGAGLTVGAGVLTSGIWGIVGGIAGSLFGGLFDSHKKEVNRNTQALRELTAAIYNSPSGYKIERGRYDATDVKEISRAALKYSTRGGAPVLAGAR